jgi:hypothetical protein
MERTRVLHRDQAVSFELEFGHPHEHRKKIME